MADPEGHRRALAAGAQRGPGRRALPPDRRLHQPRRRHPGDGQGRPAARRRDRAQGPGRRLRVDRIRVDRPRPHDDRAGRQPRAVGRDLRDPRRARRHRHREPRPAHGAAARHPDAGDPGRAPVHRHRARPGARRVPQGQPRAPGPARRRREMVRARRARRLDPRTLRERRTRPLRVRGARQLPRRPLPARPRADRGRVYVDDPPHPVLRERRAEGRLQRADLLHAGRQPAGRPGAGPAEHVAGGGLLLRDHRGWRDRALSRADDGRRRGRDRHGEPRPQALRAVDDDRVCGAEERGVLRARLPAAPPGRGARGLPAAPHRALLRPGEGAGGAVRPGERLGAAELFRPGRVRRPCRAQLPARRLVALRRRGGEGDPRGRRDDRRHRLRQACGEGSGGDGVPRLVHHEPAAETGSAVAQLRADRGRDDPDRVHDLADGRARVLSGVGRRLGRLRRRLPQEVGRGPDGGLRRHRGPGGDHPGRGVRGCRPAVAGAAGGAAARREIRRGRSGTSGSRGCRGGGSSS